MTLRPYGIVLDGALELGLELVVADGRIAEVRPHTGVPDAFVLSPAFVNAHSHLEYLGLEGRVGGEEFVPWIRELTRMKAEQSVEEVLSDAMRAAELNRATGVAYVAEHSDRPVAGPAMAAAGLDGAIFQEVITVREIEDPAAKLELVAARAEENRRAFKGPVHPSPHAIYTVGADTVAALGRSGAPLSIHVAETEFETLFTRYGEGPIADSYRLSGLAVHPSGKSVVGTLDELGLVRPGVQFVHCCALEEGDIGSIRSGGVGVAHCPRSNERLRCPRAPIREMLDAGIQVGLGMDSAASSGPVDMFAEMRAAVAVSHLRGRPVSFEEVWHMATEMGRRSVPVPGGPWRIEVGSTVPLLAIDVPDAACTADLVERGAPELVRWR